jgi:hypothetical protein
LTSAQARTALEGQDNLKRLIIQSKNRIQIIAASGIDSVNAIDIIRNTRVNKETRISGLHAGSSVHIGLYDESVVGDGIDTTGLESLRGIYAYVCMYTYIQMYTEIYLNYIYMYICIGGYDIVAVDKVECLVNIVNSTFDLKAEVIVGLNLENEVQTEIKVEIEKIAEIGGDSEVYICIYIHIFLYAYIYIYICICGCIYVYICMYICI